MASHKSAKKSIKQTLKRTAINKSRTSRIRSFIKKLEVLINRSDKKAAMDTFKTTQSEIMRGVTKGVLKKNTASRRVSRLFAKIKAIAS